jgi:tetratricopeptide (TPR) repeat protein
MSGSPSSELILAQLARILSSTTFGTSSRASAFLEHVVRKTVEGRRQEIKEATIGSEVFGREHGYDTKLDPVVRSVARIVREKLNDYYLAGRSEDWVRIELPKGSYVPVFRQLGQPAMPEVRRKVWNRPGAGLAVALGMAAIIWLVTINATESRGDARIPAYLRNDASALYRVGHAKSLRGDRAEALPLLRRASQLRPRDQAVHQELAEDLLSLGYAAEALTEAKQALQHGKSSQPLEAQATFLAASGEHESAVAAFTQLTAMQPQDLHYVVALAQVQKEASHYEACLQTIRGSRATIGTAASQDPQLWLEEAFCLAGTGDYHAALDPARRAVALAQSQNLRGVYARSRLLESGLLMSTGHLREAQPIRDEAGRICRQIGDEPCVIRALRVQANQEVVANPKKALGDYQAAYIVARKIGASGEIGQLLNGEGYALMALEDWAAANSAFTAAMVEARKAGFSNAGIRGNLAEIELRQGQFTRAASEAKEVAEQAHAARNADGEVAARLLLAQALLKQGDWSGAQAEVKQCGDLAARTALPDLSRSHILLMNARLQRARKQYRSAADLLRAARRYSEDWFHDWDLRLETTEELVDLGLDSEARRSAQEMLAQLDQGGPQSAKARLLFIAGGGVGRR